MKIDNHFIKANRELEWGEIEKLVFTFQQGFRDPILSEASKDAAEELIQRFSPLFCKYLRILNGGEINFYDKDTKIFVFSFVEKDLRKGFPLNKKEIIYRFRFVVKTYGALEEAEMLSDMHEIFLKIAKRYQDKGRHFCAYLYNVFHYEMSRHIKKYIENPLNIPYRNDQLNDKDQNSQISIDYYIDDYYEKQEVLGINWINGTECDKIFETLSPLDRKILIAYYIEDKNDKQIAQLFGIHMNTINQRRKKALVEILNRMPNSEELYIKRSRKVSKKDLTEF